MSKKKILLNMLFLVACSLITLKYVVGGRDLDGILHHINRSNGTLWLLALALVVAFILSESVIIHYLLNTLNVKSKITHCFLYSFVGFFFCLITPSATGGQPVQAVFMKQDKIPYHISSLILLIVTVIYKVVLIFIGGVVLIARPHRIMFMIRDVMGWMYVGMALNIIVVAIMLCLLFEPKVAMLLMRGAIKLIKPFVSERRIEHYYSRLDKSIENYGEASRYIGENKKVILNVLGITFFQRFCYFLITYVVMISFGIYGNPIVIVTLQALISMAVDMMPLPGGLGISEHLFTMIFTNLIGFNLCTPVLVVTRGISFYSQLLLSAVFTVVAYFIIFGRKKDDRIL